MDRATNIKGEWGQNSSRRLYKYINLTIILVEFKVSNKHDECEAIIARMLAREKGVFNLRLRMILS